VRQSAQRLADPAVLSISEIQGLLQNLDSDLHRTLVLTAAVTGLRRSELRGLQWKDIDFKNLWITPRIGIVRSMQTKLKTRASRRGIPMPLGLADVMLHWGNVSVYNQADDWVFASESTGGVSPVWLDVVFAKYIKPAARKAGIHKKIGWHTFRHSLASLLAHKGEDVKVVQELLRHANASTTMELYQQADTTAKRIAQSHTDNLFNLPRNSTTRTSEGIYPMIPHEARCN
jgi:integrase